MALIIARQAGRVVVLLNPESPVPDQRAVVLHEDLSGLPPRATLPAASLLTRGDAWQFVEEPLPPTLAAYLELIRPTVDAGATMPGREGG